MKDVATAGSPTDAAEIIGDFYLDQLRAAANQPVNIAASTLQAAATLPTAVEALNNAEEPEDKITAAITVAEKVAQIGAAAYGTVKAVQMGKGGANPTTRAAAARGSTLHSDKPGHLPDQLRARYPNTTFEFTKPGQAGQDVKVLGGQHPSEYPGSSWPAGVDHGDFKPGTPSGTRTFTRDQTTKWSDPTHMLPYDPNSGQLQ